MSVPPPNNPGSEMDPPDWFQELDHTADAGIVITAPSIEELFSRAAWGMFSLITDIPSVRSVRSLPISVTADDERALMIRWLSELNLRHVTDHVLFNRFDIARLSSTHLEAVVHGEPIDPERHVVYTEIKAVTFHELRIDHADHTWTAQIIFDL